MAGPGEPQVAADARPDDRSPPLPRALVPGDAGANIFSMLEEHEVALALAELHVKHADAFPISRRRLRGSKASVKAHWRLNKSSDYLKRTF